MVAKYLSVYICIAHQVWQLSSRYSQSFYEHNKPTFVSSWANEIRIYMYLSMAYQILLNFPLTCTKVTAWVRETFLHIGLLFAAIRWHRRKIFPRRFQRPPPHLPWIVELRFNFLSNWRRWCRDRKPVMTLLHLRNPNKRWDDFPVSYCLCPVHSGQSAPTEPDRAEQLSLPQPERNGTRSGPRCSGWIFIKVH